jgi:hypothetical protein
MNIKGFFASFGKVAAIGRDQDEVLRVTGAPQAAPLSEQSMSPEKIKQLADSLMKEGYLVVECDKTKKR